MAATWLDLYKSAAKPDQPLAVQNAPSADDEELDNTIKKELLQLWSKVYRFDIPAADMPDLARSITIALLERAASLQHVSA